MDAPTLELAPDGSHLVVASPDAVHVIDLATGTPVHHAAPGLRAFALVASELWLAAGDPPMLEIAGHAERHVLFGAGRLIHGLGGHGVWLGTRVLRVARTADGLDVRPLAGVDFALPIGGTRMVTATQHVIQLRDSTTTRWSATPVVDGRVCEGAVISDGRAIALYLEQRAETGTIVVLDATHGHVQHRIRVRGATLVRFAPKRGLAAVVVGHRRLVLIDLRFGRILADHAQDREVRELAVDPAGQLIALRYDDRYGEVVQLDVAHLLAMPVRSETIDVEDATVEPTPVVEAPPPPRVRRQITLAPCPALPARTPQRVPNASELSQLLATQRAWTVAVLDHAIARAWDEGRATPDRPTPQRNVIASIAGELRGLANDDVAHASLRVEHAAAAWHDALSRTTSGVPAIRVLAAEHGLDVLAQQILLLVAAPALWGELAQLFGMLVADGARPLCDELLVSTVLSPIARPHEIAAALDGDAPLVRSGLVQIGAGLQRPFLALGADPVVVRLLRGAAPEVGAAIRPATRTFEELNLRDDIAQRIVDELARASTPLRVVVRGRRGSGRHTLLATIAGASHRALAVLDTKALAHDGVDALRTALLRTQLAGFVPCLDNLDRVEPAMRDQIRDLLRAFTGPVMLRMPNEANAPLDPGYVAIDLPSQTVSERTIAWEAALARANLVIPDTAELAARFAVGPGVIERVTERVARDPGARVTERIDAAIRQHLDSDLGEVATRVHRLATWSQVMLPADIQDSVTELIGRIRHRRRVFDTWGFDRVMSTSRGVTALFAGGPGTGKTLVASAIANELGLELYRVDVSRIMSKWIGETEQRLAKLFDAAEDANAIILFDEADSLFGKRTEVKSSVDRYANVEVNYLLQRLDTFEGIAILTSNLGSSIDNAFKRRLSFRLTFPFPDEEQREQLWRAHLPPQLPIRGQLDLQTLAQRYRLSGGYIRNCALRAAFLAAEHGGTLTADHLERAVKAEFREIGKLAETGALE